MKLAHVRVVAALLCAAFLSSLASLPAIAQSDGAAVTGLVVDQKTALPLSNAAVVLSQGGTTVASTHTDQSGRYNFPGVNPGIYDVTVRAAGYSTTVNSGVVVAGSATTTVDAALVVSSAASGAGNVIGRTSASARSSLASTTTISQTLDIQSVVQTGQIRFADQLGTLPAINLSTSSSVGDDVSINIRGFGSSETATLLDGHPVGPLGVLANNTYNYALTPNIGLSNVTVTYGSGAQGLYGSDTIAGSVNMQTINPTKDLIATYMQQVGGFGLLSSSLTGSGTFGHFGFAVAAGVSGEYGDFFPGQIFQSARPSNVSSNSVNPNGACNNSSGTDVSLCNQQVSTYAVSQNTKLTSDMIKMRYDISPVTNITATAYDSVQWSDSTGNGDNDNLPYSSRLAQIQNSPSNCTLPNGSAGYTVITDPINNVTSCYTAQQWAANSSGPDGGGAGRQRSARMTDYHVRLNTTFLNFNNITVDYFYNNYSYWKDSSLAGGYNVDGQLLGTPVFADYYNTQGILAADEITTGKNDASFGYFVYHQLQTGNQLVGDPNPADTTGGLVFQAMPAYFFGEASEFLNDNYQFSDQYGLFANLWLKHSSVTNQTTFDPRISFQVRPTTNDVFRLTYGRSDGAPAPSLKSTGPVIATNPGSSLTAVSCDGFNEVGAGGNPNLQSESANDFEAGYGHRFKGDSSVQVNAYVTTVANQLFTASQPLPAFGVNNVIFTPGTLATYESHLNEQCGLSLNDTTVLPYLSVGTTYNANSALARGIEISGRERFAPIAYIEYQYSMESSFRTGIPANILMNNPTLTNNTQILGIPLHQGTISLDVAAKGWEFRLDNYYTEFNNGLNRPSYWYSNAFVSKSFNKGTTLLTLGGTNIFNQATQVYGYIGQGTFAPENQFFNDGSALQQFVNGNYSAEEFGIAPPQITFTLQQRI